MEKLFWRFRAAFLPFVHLFHQKLYSGISDFINLLPYGADRDDGFHGDRGIVKANKPVLVRKPAVFAKNQVQHNAGMGIVG